MLPERSFRHALLSAPCHLTLAITLILTGCGQDATPQKAEPTPATTTLLAEIAADYEEIRWVARTAGLPALTLAGGPVRPTRSGSSRR